jgi:hypothetical protein
METVKKLAERRVEVARQDKAVQRAAAINEEGPPSPTSKWIASEHRTSLGDYNGHQQCTADHDHSASPTDPTAGQSTGSSANYTRHSADTMPITAVPHLTVLRAPNSHHLHWQAHWTQWNSRRCCVTTFSKITMSSGRKRPLPLYIPTCNNEFCAAGD